MSSSTNPRAQWLALLPVLLSACTVGPDFQHPATTTATAYTSEPLASLQAQDGQQLATGQNPAADWWSLFQSEALNATMLQALAENRTVAAAQATLEQAREAANASAGGLYPQVGMNAAAGRQKYGAQFLGAQPVPPFTYFAAGASVSYLLDYTGGQRRTVEQQRALADYQAYELQAARLSVTGNVVAQALVIASTRAQIDAIEILLSQDRQNLSLVQTAFDAGSGTRVDLLSAQSHLANDETLLPPLNQQLSMARHALSILAGRAPAEWSPPEFNIRDLKLPGSLPVSLPSELAHRRPDILAAEAQLHAATAAVGITTSRLYPQISLTASGGPQATKLSNLFDQSGLAWSLGAGLTEPVFDGGTLRAQNRGAKDAMQAAFAQYQQVVLQSFGQVADVLTALDHDSEELSAQQNAFDTSEANLSLTRQSFSVGNVGVLQVLDAERLWQQARLGLVRAQATRYQDTAQLFLALGGNPLVSQPPEKRVD